MVVGGGGCWLVVRSKVGSKMSLLKWPVFNNFMVPCWHDSCKSIVIKHQGKQCEREVSVFSMSQYEFESEGSDTGTHREESTAEALRMCSSPVNPRMRQGSLPPSEAISNTSL